MDASGREIEQIASYEVGTYMIYFVKGDYLKAYFTDAYEVRSYFDEHFQMLMGQVRAMNVKNDRNHEYVRQSLASAYYNEVNGYHQVAIGELTGLKNKLYHKNYAKWLIAYMICNIALVMGCILEVTFCPIDAIQQISCCISSSCIGSFLVYTKKENQHNEMHLLPIVDAIISFFASCVSGFIVYCILQTNLILGAFTENNYSMMIVCFIAGFNEDMPLKLLKSISNMIGNGKDLGKNNTSSNQ